jgi:UDP-N-acetylmuramoyl-L-alanyl-D-glutamate--2,6-diaminopimelate ligase
MAIDRPQYIVDDSRTALGLMCHALAGSPTDRMTTIGVAGTDGKTVTSHLIYSVLHAAEVPTGMSSSIESRCGFQSLPPLAEFNAPTIADALSQMAMANCSHGVVEAASIPLAQRAFDGLSLKVAVLTNIRRGNAAYHGNHSNYLRATTRILDYVRESGLVIVNVDDPTLRRLTDSIRIPVLTIGIHHAADCSAKLIDRNACFQTFMLSAGNTSIPVRTKILGKQHIYNCLSAVATGLALGIDLKTIVHGLETAIIPGRLERVDCGQPFGLWIDSASSPPQLAGAIDAVSRITNGDLWCVCTASKSQTADDRRQIGELLERAAEKTIITSDSSTSSPDFEPAHQILDGFQQPAAPMVIPNRLTAIQWTLAHAKPGDSIVIAGCGERPFMVDADHEWAWNDRDVCQAWLYDNRLPRTLAGGDCRIFNIKDYRK